MKGVIRENLGSSRYIVGVSTNMEPVTAILEDLNQQYDDISQKLIDAQGKLAEAQAPYESILAEIEVASEEYQACVNAFNLGQCVDGKLADCQNAYDDCDHDCDQIDSGPGECDLPCQQARDACRAACKRALQSCQAVAGIECQEAFQAALSACQKEWMPYITNLQTSAQELLGAVQDAARTVAILEAQQLSLARRINELDGVASKEEQVTCFRAQYKADLEAETEVEVARTPAGRTVITEIASPGVCLQDSRALPSGHLYVNAATYPGWETWRPTWRTGTVKEILAEQNKLKVEIKGGTLAGSLGTIHSVDPLDCTPAQTYFDGNWQTAEQRIKEARDALKEAQEDLLAAAKVRDDCIDQYDQTWSNACYTGKAATCDSIWAEWLTECYDFGGNTECQDLYESGIANCAILAESECLAEQSAELEACSSYHQPLIDAATQDRDDLIDEVAQKNQELASAQAAVQDILDEIQACIDEFDADWLQDCIDNYEGDEPEIACQIKMDQEIEACQNEKQDALDAANAEVVAIQEELNFLQIELSQANQLVVDRVASLDACIGTYDLNWVEACASAKEAECVSALDEFLAQCNQDKCIELRDAGLAACYAQGLADCADERDALIAQCREDYQPAVDTAKETVDAASSDLHSAYIARYQPASPLVLELPVEHCVAASYRVEDDVLIDFPVRVASTDNPMAVWESGRVIGWAAETAVCCCGVNTTLKLKRTSFPAILDDNDDGIADDDEYWGFAYDKENGTDIPLADNSFRCDGDYLLIDINDSLAFDRYFYLFPLLQDSTPLEISLRWESSGAAEVWLIYIDESQPGASEQNVQAASGTTYCLLIGVTDIKVKLGAGANIKLWVKMKGHTLAYCDKPAMSMEAYNALLESFAQQTEEANEAIQAATNALSACSSDAYATLEACCLTHAADYLIDTYGVGTSEEELNQIVYINGLPVTLRSIYIDAIRQCEGGNFGCNSEYSNYIGVVNNCNETLGPAVAAASAAAEALADLIRDTLYKAKPC